MNELLASPKTRLENWKKIRKELEDLNEQYQLEKVVELWSEVPLYEKLIDWDDPKSWFTPWEMIYYEYFCPSSLAILMEQTLLNIKNSPWEGRTEVVLILDNEKKIMDLACLVDNSYLLNYSHGEIVKIKDVKNNFEIQQRYKFNRNYNFYEKIE